MTLLLYLLSYLHTFIFDPHIKPSWKKKPTTKKHQQRLLANRSPRYWLMSSVRLQPEECWWFRMTLTLPLVGVGLQSKYVYLDQFLPAGGVITWGGLQLLTWTQPSELKTQLQDSLQAAASVTFSFFPPFLLVFFFFRFGSADFASFF